jgi:hypothetical protein
MILKVGKKGGKKRDCICCWWAFCFLSLQIHDEIKIWGKSFFVLGNMYIVKDIYTLVPWHSKFSTLMPNI